MWIHYTPNILGYITTHNPDLPSIKYKITCRREKEYQYFSFNGCIYEMRLVELKGWNGFDFNQYPAW